MPGLGLEQIQGHATETGKILRPVAFADTPLVVGEADVQAPVQAIFHAPMATDILQKLARLVCRPTADVVAILTRSLAVDGSLALNANEAAKFLPLAPLSKPTDLRCRPDAALFDSPMAAVGRQRSCSRSFQQRFGLLVRPHRFMECIAYQRATQCATLT